MKLKNVLIVVKDIESSKRFYHELFGLMIVSENEGNVILTEGLVLQDAALWQQSIEKEVVWKNHAALLYFEERDIEGLAKKLENYETSIAYLTPLTKLPWGQKMLRFYDLDGNLLEVRTQV